MVSTSTIAAVDFALGAVAAAGLLYLYFAETVVVHYERFFRLITLGLLVYAVTGPIIGSVAPAYIHAIHATAALFITAGLFDLVREDLDSSDDFRAVLAAGSDLDTGEPADDD